jgi:hypothetical protein
MKGRDTMKIYILIFVLPSMFLSSCDLINPGSNGIRWHEENLDGYVLYGFQEGGNTLAVVDLGTSEVPVILNDFEGIQSVITNDDGSKLYVSTGTGHAGSNPGYIYEVDTKTWQYRIIYENAAHLLSNRNGGIYFITKLKIDAIRVFGKIDHFSGAVTEIDTINVYWAAWFDQTVIEIHPNEPLVYYINENHEFWRFNYQFGEKLRIFSNLNFRPVANFVLSGGGDTLYIPNGPVLDLQREEIVGYVQANRLGWLVVRRDNREIYITAPYNPLYQTLPFGIITIYCPHRNQIIDEIDIIVDGMRRDSWKIYLTREERYAVLNDRSAGYYIIDLKSRDIVYSHRFVENNRITLSIADFYLAPKPPSGF